MRKATLTSLVLIAGIAATPSGFAMGSGVSTSIAPVILSVAANLKQGRLVISGQHFGTASPAVRLGNLPLQVESASPDTIVVRLPAGTRPATYLITVTAKPGRAVTSDMFYATLF